MSHRILRSAKVLVPQAEVDTYAERVPPERIIPLPEGVVGIPDTRNWILDNIPGKAVTIFDDDFIACNTCVYRVHTQIPYSCVDDMILATAQAAADLGIGAFGWTQNAGDASMYNPTRPFALVGLVSSAIGVLDRSIRWDTRLRSRCDIDFTLQHLEKHRIVWIENRYVFQTVRNDNVGGNARERTTEQIRRDIELTRNKWPGCVNVVERPSGICMSISVSRSGRKTLFE